MDQTTDLRSLRLSQDSDDIDQKDLYIQYLERKVEEYSSHSNRLGEELKTFCLETHIQTTRVQEEIVKKDSIIQDLKDKLRAADSRASMFSQRFDYMAAAGLTNLKPSSDEALHRRDPPEIAQKYKQEFYRVTWANVFKQLCDEFDITESNIIKLLLDVFMISVRMCKTAAIRQRENINRVLAIPGANVYISSSETRNWTLPLQRKRRKKKCETHERLKAHPHSGNASDDVSSSESVVQRIEINPQLKGNCDGFVGACQRSFTEDYLKLLIKDVMQKTKNHAIFIACNAKSGENKKGTLLKILSQYVSRSVTICWQMAIQDPPMYVETSHPIDEKLDSNKYDVYGVHGYMVADVILPVVHFFEFGMVAAKGVVRLH